MQRNKFLTVWVVGLAVFSLISLASGDALAKRQINLVIAGGPLGGAFYPIAGGIASIVNKNVEGVKMNVQVTGGGVENTRIIGTGQVDLGLIAADQGYNALRKLRQFKKDTLKLEALGTLHPTVTQIVTLKKNNLKTFLDLKGKKVSIGMPGGGAEMQFDMLLESSKLTRDDFKTVYLPYNQSSEQLADGLIDAAVILAGVPTAAVSQLAANHQISFIEIPENIWQKFAEIGRFYEMEEFEPGLYKNVNEPQKLIVMRIQLACRVGLAEDLAYDITKAIYTHLDELGTHHAAAKLIKLKSAHKAAIPLNKGAEKFFKEVGNIK